MMTVFEIQVEGLPPAKSGRSIFGQRSTHHNRLTRLLEAAHREKSAKGFGDFGKRPIGVEIEVRAPAGQVPGDGPNYIGGIADALEIKRKRARASGSLEHLKYRQHVGFYEDDAQIKEITYREVPAEDLSYVVRLRSLP